MIGFGSLAAEIELENMACWGSGGSGIPCANGTITHFTAANQAQLSATFETIIEQINFDPCCGFNDCSFNPEPTTGEVDPVQPESTSGDSSSTGVDETGTTATPTTTATGPGESTAGEESTTTAADESSSGTTDPSTTGTPGTTTTDATATDTDDTFGVSGGDSGCGCSTDGPSGQGWLGSLLGLGLLGLARRRRRR